MQKQTIIPKILAVSLVVMAMPAAATESSENQTVTVGPWTITTTYKGDSFENCTMSRTVDDLGISFLRKSDGLLLTLDSSKWRLEQGKSYPVHLAVGPQDVETKALASTKSVTITLNDTDLNKRLRVANTLKIRGEGRRWLSRSTAAQRALNGSRNVLRRTSGKARNLIRLSRHPRCPSGLLALCPPLEQIQVKPMYSDESGSNGDECPKLNSRTACG